MSSKFIAKATANNPTKPALRYEIQTNFMLIAAMPLNFWLFPSLKFVLIAVIITK